MSKKVVDQHDVVNRGWNEADTLAETIRTALWEAERGRMSIGMESMRTALRRYEEARNG